MKTLLTQEILVIRKVAPTPTTRTLPHNNNRFGFQTLGSFPMHLANYKQCIDTFLNFQH